VRLLVIGGGGREHALCWALRREDPDSELYCAPGNPGTAEIAHNLSIAADDLDRIADAADMRAVDLTIVGPELPLARGLADRLQAEGRAVFGPSAAASQIEASKHLAKQVMAAGGVRTAASRSFTDLRAALGFVERHPEPLVVKASGLAAGKGAIVCTTRREAERAVRAMLEERRFGDAGDTVVIESYLEGEEVSVMAVTDGHDLELLPVAQDHKRLHEGDRGPNTGGMGAYSPVALAGPGFVERVKRDIFLPTLEELQRRRTPFSGVLYAGLMIDGAGVPWVVEFNCRLGDPEAQVVLPLISEGLTDCLLRVAQGQAPSRINLKRGAAVTTVLASTGYPEQPETGAAITLPDTLPPEVLVFHGGTARGMDDTLRVAGGRVFAVTGLGPSFTDAQLLSRQGAEAIHFPGKVFRRDIGWRELARQERRTIPVAP
jgi:phosphoribosylamine---glycine ligase